MFLTVERRQFAGWVCLVKQEQRTLDAQSSTGWRRRPAGWKEGIRLCASLVCYPQRAQGGQRGWVKAEDLAARCSSGGLTGRAEAARWRAPAWLRERWSPWHRAAPSDGPVLACTAVMYGVSSRGAEEAASCEKAWLALRMWSLRYDVPAAAAA